MSRGSNDPLGVGAAATPTTPNVSEKTSGEPSGIAQGAPIPESTRLPHLDAPLNMGGKFPAAATNLDAAKALPDPGVVTRNGTQPTVQTPDQADKLRDKTKEDEGTSLKLHPPLSEADRIQGPNDRGNRKPTDRELEHGRLVKQGVLAPTEQVQLQSQQEKINDPEIDKSAPQDKPSDPRRVAESRGLKLEPEPQPA